MPAIPQGLLESDIPVPRSVILRADASGAIACDSALADVFDLASSLSPSTTNRIRIFVPTGNYRLATPFVVPAFCDFNMAPGAQFGYVGTDYTQPIVSIAIGSTIENGGSWTGLNVSTLGTHKWHGTDTGGSVDLDHFACIRFGNCLYSTIDIVKAAGAAIGIALHATTGGIVAHNNIKIGSMTDNRYHVSLRGGLSNGWVNENRFWGPQNYSCGSGFNRGGSSWVVRTSVEAGGGSTEQNNNIFIHPCIQQANQSGGAWASGLTLGVGEHVNTAGRDYVTTVAGVTSGGAPSHTSGTAASGTATLAYSGVFRRGHVLIDGGGSYIKMSAARSENMYGVPITVAGASAALGENCDLEYLVFSGQVLPPDIPNHVHTEVLAPSNLGQKAITANVKWASLENISTFSVGSIHNSVIIGSTGKLCAGMQAINTANVVGALSLPGVYNGNAILTKYGLYQSYSNVGNLGLILPVTDYFRKWRITTNGRSATVGGQLVFSALDKDFKRLTHQVGNLAFHASHGVVSAGTNYNNTAWQTNNHGTSFVEAARSDVVYLTVTCLVGQLENISVSPIRTRFSYGDVALGGPPDPLCMDARGGQRYVSGTVVAGAFPFVGERIHDVASATSYRVTTAGIIAPDWVTATAMVIGEYRSNAGHIYSSAAAGTTGATAPTHTSGSVSDGTVTWDYVGPTAAIA